jgi:hypothetical protein
VEKYPLDLCAQSFGNVGKIQSIVDRSVAKKLASGITEIVLKSFHFNRSPK